MNKKERSRIIKLAKVWAAEKDGAGFKDKDAVQMAKVLVGMHEAIVAHLDRLEWKAIDTAPHDRPIEIASVPDEKGRFHHTDAEWGKNLLGAQGWFHPSTGRRVPSWVKWSHWRERRSLNAPE